MAVDGRHLVSKHKRIVDAINKMERTLLGTKTQKEAADKTAHNQTVAFPTSKSLDHYKIMETMYSNQLEELRKEEEYIFHQLDEMVTKWRV